MEASFWHKKWESNQIGFHANQPNHLLVKYIDQLNLKDGSRVFIPLCGKTLDIAWLLSKGYKVSGAELSEMAIQQLFKALKLTPEITNIGTLIHYHTENIDLFVGDIFNLSPDILGSVDAVFDRAALVALPIELRKQYTAHLTTLTANAPQLLICFEYDQSEMNGPPFSIVSSEVKQHYAADYDVTLLDSPSLEGGLKGRLEATETLWLLARKT